MNRLARRLVPRTLRARLLIGVLALAGAGMLAADLALYWTLDAALTDRVDRILVSIAAVADRPDSRPAFDARNADTLVRRTGVTVVAVDADFRIIATFPRTGPGEPPEPAAHLDQATLRRLARHPGRPVSLNAAGTHCRIVFQPVRAEPGARRPVAALVVATSLTEQRQTLKMFAVGEAVVTTAILALMAALAVAVLRLGLRPLTGLAVAATAIAAGQSDRRLPVDGPRGELGRVAAALNRAFDERHRAEERLRHFITDASHELRTPLATIRGWADLYFQGALDHPDGVDTAMTRIVDDADRLSRLVDELFLLARLDQHPHLDTAEVDLTALVAEVVEDARVADPTREITMTKPATLTVTGDADRLRQVARNLVGNALRHTPPDTPVRVDLRSDPDGSPTAHLTVADDGPGIPAPDLAHLFERFYRAAGARGTAGTGLGLAIVQAVVHAHGGTVTVHSAPGSGTRFEVTLPAGAAGP